MAEAASETAQLLERWHAGEEEALDTLVERHLPWIEETVRRRLGSLLRSKAETHDLVQEVLVEFLKYGPRFLISSRAHFRALLARIAENVIRGQHDHFTARRRAIARERPLPTESILDLDGSLRAPRRPSEAAQDDEWRALVHLSLGLLDPIDREAILLREWDRLSFPEIGEELGISEDAARMRFRRALARLANCIQRVRLGEIDELLDDEAREGRPPP